LVIIESSDLLNFRCKVYFFYCCLLHQLNDPRHLVWRDVLQPVLIHVHH
jgi:hypothetical protein